MTQAAPPYASDRVIAMEQDSSDLSLSGRGRDSASAGDCGEIFRVESERQLRAMCADILRPDRDYPIVGLTCRPGARDPALPVDQVRSSIWPTVPVYVIEPQQARAAHTVLPDRLGAYNGAARVWWPGVDEHSDQSWHPLIYDSTGVYGDDALRRLAIEFERQCPSPIDLTPEQQGILNERLRARSERRCRELEERVRELEGQCRNLEQQSTAAEHHAKAGYTALDTPAEDRDIELPTNEKVERRGDGERLYVLIVEKWVETFSGPHDWSQSPLASFVFSDQFLRALDDSDRLPLERIAWVCAMVACGKARRLGGIDPHQLLTGAGGRQLVREDGAKGWRCNLKRNSPGGARLHYWIHTSGKIEFDALGNHDLRGEL
jgi:hypothetical protein